MNARETMEALMAGRTVRGSNGCMYMLDPEGNLLVFYSNGDIGPALSFDPMLDYEAVKRDSAPEIIIEALLQGKAVRFYDHTYWIDRDLLRRQRKDDDPCTLAYFSKGWAIIDREGGP